MSGPDFMRQPVEWLRQYAENPTVASFQLMGEDLVRLTATDVAAIGASYRQQLDAIPGELRSEFQQQQEQLARSAHSWLTRYNRNLRTRVRGYLHLGDACGFAYPWPTVAILGICQVISGLSRSRIYGLVGTVAARLHYERLEYFAESTEDILRRTNRGIFADSVPMVLYALRCHELRQRGQKALAEALLAGPLPALMDEECRTLMRELVSGLEIQNDDERFRCLANLTLKHFDREQSVFTHHMGADKRQTYAPIKGWLGSLIALKQIPAPVVTGHGERRRVAFRDYQFPPGFDLRNHRDRVTHFGEAFVSSVTRNVDDYVIATDYVRDRFGSKLDLARCVYSP